MSVELIALMLPAVMSCWRVIKWLKKSAPELLSVNRPDAPEPVVFAPGVWALTVTPGRDFALRDAGVALVRDGGDVAAGIGRGRECRVAAVRARKNIIAVGVLGVAELDRLLDQLADFSGVLRVLLRRCGAVRGQRGDLVDAIADGLEAVHRGIGRRRRVLKLRDVALILAAGVAGGLEIEHLGHAGRVILGQRDLEAGAGLGLQRVLLLLQLADVVQKIVGKHCGGDAHKSIWYFLHGFHC